MSAAAKPFRVTGWHVLAGVTAFFVLIMGFDVWFATLAYRTFPGEDAKDPYEAGIAYNRTLAKREAQAQLGWTVSDEKFADGLSLKPLDAHGAPLTGLTVTAVLVRPATESGKRLISLKEVSPGVYEARGLGLSGAWDMTVTLADAQGRQFEANRRLQWP
ncbi:MAG TPA: FixH family protein [Caulobacteraceae bacterium]|nr:FixH family protein [Caulobacteraceae bacterium]